MEKLKIKLTRTGRNKFGMCTELDCLHSFVPPTLSSSHENPFFKLMKVSAKTDDEEKYDYNSK